MLFHIQRPVVAVLKPFSRNAFFSWSFFVFRIAETSSQFKNESCVFMLVL